jgi:hypothetical protein
LSSASKTCRRPPNKASRTCCSIAATGRWTFQIVEEFDETYYRPVAAMEQHVRDALMGGRRHVFEAELKERRRTHGRPGHEARPDDMGRSSGSAGATIEG